MAKQQWIDRIKNGAIDAMISTPIGLLVGILLAWFAKMPLWLILLCAVLSVIPIFGIRLSATIEQRKRLKARSAFFLRPIKTIPNATADNEEWKSWVRQMVALLRGRGRLQKAKVLREIIDEAKPEDRPKIAENFLRGLAEEAKAGKPSSD